MSILDKALVLCDAQAFTDAGACKPDGTNESGIDLGDADPKLLDELMLNVRVNTAFSGNSVDVCRMMLSDSPDDSTYTIRMITGVCSCDVAGDWIWRGRLPRGLARYIRINFEFYDESTPVLATDTTTGAANPTAGAIDAWLSLDEDAA